MVQVAGLAGFVDGVFKGMDWAEGLKDRKRGRATEDEEHAWRREQQDWAREDQAAQRDELAFTKAERERLKTYREDDAAAWNATVDQMKGIGPDGTATAPRRDPMDMPDVAGNQRLGFGIPTREEVEAAQPGVTRPAQPAAPQGVGRLGLSTMNARPPAAAGQPPQVMSEAPTRGPDPAAPAPVVLVDPNTGQRQLSIRDLAREIGPEISGYGAGRVDPRLAGAAGIPQTSAGQPVPATASEPTYEQWAAMNRSQREAVGLPVSAIGGEWRYQNDKGDAREKAAAFAQAEEQAKAQIAEEYARRQARQSQPPQQTAQDAAGRRAQSIADAVGEIRSPITVATDALGRGGQRLIQGANTALGYGASAVGATDTGAEAFRRADRYGGHAEQGAPAAAPAQAAAPAAAPDQPGRSSTVLPAVQPAQLSFGEAPAPAAPAGTGAAAAEKAARTTFGMGIIGEGMPVKTTPARRERAAADGLRMFNEQEMPAIVERFLRTGRVKEAEAFQEWAKQQGVQKGIKSYMAATHAMMLRDTDAAEKHLTDVFNNADYYDDGFSIPKGGLEIIEGEGGKIRRARLTMVNDRTGESVTQEYSGEDLMMMAYSALDPVAAFEAGWAAVNDPKKKPTTSDTLKDLKSATEILKAAIEAEAKSRGEEYPNAEAILEGYSAAEVIAAAQALQANPGADIFSLLGDVPVATFE
ncbi:hypothetical protein [Cereibacter sphaeroides]|uniref:hypothetical protein n=1 Tax=Cereibacter sphaeroides TaxID=1063 RepID=UPI00313DFFCA